MALRSSAQRHVHCISTPLPEPVLVDLLRGPSARVCLAGQGQDRAVRAAGVPLYAVETIRALIDRDLVIPRDGVYRLVGDVGELDCPGLDRPR